MSVELLVGRRINEVVLDDPPSVRQVARDLSRVFGQSRAKAGRLPWRLFSRISTAEFYVSPDQAISASYLGNSVCIKADKKYPDQLVAAQVCGEYMRGAAPAQLNVKFWTERPPKDEVLFGDGWEVRITNEDEFTLSGMVSAVAGSFPDRLWGVASGLAAVTGLHRVETADLLTQACRLPSLNNLSVFYEQAMRHDSPVDAARFVLQHFNDVEQAVHA